MYLGNVVGLIVVLTCVPLFAAILRIPFSIIAPIILVFCAIGAYTVHNSTFDVVLMLVFGVVGYVMKKCNYPLAPMVLAIVLGDKAEEAFRQSLLSSQGQPRHLLLERAGQLDHGARPDRPVLAADLECADAAAAAAGAVTEVASAGRHVPARAETEHQSGLHVAEIAGILYTSHEQLATAPPVWQPRPEPRSGAGRGRRGVARSSRSPARKASRASAYAALKDVIVAMDVYRSRADIRLDERRLALEFGISRTPVREAMAQLEREGFVRAVPRRGIYVVRKTRREVIEMITAWAALESMAARLITEHGERRRDRLAAHRCSPRSRTASCMPSSTNIPR